MTASPAPPASPAYSSGWNELLITLAIQAMASMAVLTLPVVATIVGPAVGLSPSYAGVYIGLLYVGCTAGSLAAGAAVERWGPVRVSQGSLVLGAIGLALCCSGIVAAMVGGTLLMGLGYGQVTPASSHLLARSSPPHRMGLMFSIKQTGVPLGGMLAGALVPGLMLVVGWRQGLACVALGCLACALMAQVLRARLDAQRDPASSIHLGKLAEPLRLVLRQERLQSLALCSVFLSSVQMCLTTYTVIYLTSELGFGLVAAGFALSVCQLAGVAGRIAWGYVADRALGAMRMLALLAGLIVVCCIGIALLQVTTPRAVILMLLALFGATAIGWNGVFLAEVARQAPAGFAGLATGGVSAFTFFGAMVAPPLFALMSSLTGSYRTGYAMLALPMLWCGWRLWQLHRAGPVAAAAHR
jgi:MFS family permease